MYIKPEHYQRHHQEEDVWMPKVARSGIVKANRRISTPPSNKSSKVVLPSFQSFCRPVDGGGPPTSTSTIKSHTRTFSVPVCMPSQQQQRQQQQQTFYYPEEEDENRMYKNEQSKQQHRLSLTVLLDAIELDQTMYEAYRLERAKTRSFARPSDRRRSKSAPGSSTVTPRWRTPAQSSNISMQQLAESIVRQHIENAKRK
ncbi:hypothetical protein BX666DRAFT_1350007 [Dichotomocladium elegans]|nr:hypothetical protein BX666DRAFT_1350007 [Dichotomocladium elegans]